MTDDYDPMRLADAIVEDSLTAKCGHWVECTEICLYCGSCQDCCVCPELTGCICNIGDKVTDITAEANNWPDKNGEVIEVDGTNVKVRYASGKERWKKEINLRLEFRSHEWRSR